MRILFAAACLLAAFSFKNNPISTPETAPFPKGEFVSPVGHAVKLNGIFGELRPDHFHGGIDIDSKNGAVGEPIFAAADGFIDRVKVQLGGYGLALYVKHPNGYKTVYAHLDRFSPEVARWVKEKQYEKESFAVDLYPADGQFSAKKGQEIAKLGNSGSSSGPHLHFEIRESKTDKTLNPLLFDLGLVDKVAPQLLDLKAFFLNDEKETVGKQALPLLKQKGIYRLKGDTIRLAAWRVGLGLKTRDSQDGQRSNLGIYRLRLRVDDREEYEFKMDDLEFDETRFVNAHMDYAAKKATGAYFHRLYLLPGNRLKAYETAGDGGVISLYKDRPRKVTILAADAFGNESTATFWLLRDENMPSQEQPAHGFLFRWNTENSIDNQSVRLEIPRGSLYENAWMTVSARTDASGKFVSAIHQLADNRTPVHRFFPLSIRPDRPIPAYLKSKAIIGYMARPGDKPANAGGKWDGDWLVTRVRSFGNYAILLDTTAPTITPVVFKLDLTKADKMQFRIGDNLQITAQADGLNWRATVDGRWILMEFDGKKDHLTHVFDGRIGRGEHQFKLVVRDDRGNETVFEKSFVR